nr:immunoglobulin light chain junction region [Macaca mulatta]MOX85527.1 immunoglobulin light chain junction region [Macaca mulatta]MOX85612.1 immunoglobulin light chain junction region [Macaca mulatta]MOX86032.1 immunoglobulin light chain junction region [Macaca mulatta]MOX86786.1 immunoglobulin light chain junction region [Macaca mulatta]
CMQALEFPWTS